MLETRKPKSRPALLVPSRNNFFLFFIRGLGDNWYSAFDPKRPQMQSCHTTFNPSPLTAVNCLLACQTASSAEQEEETCIPNYINH